MAPHVSWPGERYVLLPPPSRRPASLVVFLQLLPEHRVACIRLEGEVTRADFITTMETLLVHPDWQPSGRLVYDLRHVSALLLDLDDLGAIDAFAEAHRDRLGGHGATAIVSTHFLVGLMGNLLRVRRARTTGGLHVVPSLEAAEQALGLATGVLAPLRRFVPPQSA